MPPLMPNGQRQSHSGWLNEETPTPKNAHLFISRGGGAQSVEDMRPFLYIILESFPHAVLKTNPLHQRSGRSSQFRSRTLGFIELLCQAGLNSWNEPQLAETRHNSEEIFGSAKWASYRAKWPKDLGNTWPLPARDMSLLVYEAIVQTEWTVLMTALRQIARFEWSQSHAYKPRTAKVIKTDRS